MKIEYSLNGGSGWIPITNNYTGVSGSTNAYNWTPIPDNRSETCIVRVSDNRTAFTSTVTDTSNANFTILPQINIYLPAVNDNLTASASGTQAIRWNYTGHTIDKVNIDYYDGANWTSIQTNINNTNNAATYFWPSVPAVKNSQAKVRVTDIDMANVTNQSGIFNIRGYLNLTAPNGNQNWAVGSTNNLITWSSSAINTVNVSYSLNNGSNGTWTYLGVAASSPYTWNISNNSQVSNQVKVMIADQDDFNTTSTSPATFAIIPVLGLQHPQSGDNVTAEESYNITWTSKGVGADNVYLQYTPTGLVGGNWTNVTDAAVPNGASGGYFLWNPVPAGPLSNYYKLRVIYAGNANATVTGDDYFNLRGKITVVAPDGGESWQIGEIHNITWTRKGYISAVDISYSYNNGTNWTTLPNAAGVNASSGTWSWNITPDTTTARQAKIMVADSNNPAVVFDVSGAPFELKGRIDIAQPNASGIVLTYDGGQSNYNIMWSKVGNISSVNLSYSTNNGTTYSNPIATNIYSTASPYAWTIPDSIGGNLRVKVEDYDNPAVNTTSANNFAIKGAIQVLSPNGNESWLVGTNQSIQWNTTGTYPGNVKIYFSDNSGTNWTELGQVGAGQHNVTQTWYWDPVPDNITASGLIRVATQVNNASVDVSDDSNNTFKIRGNVLVTQPNGGEVWFANETNRQIRWTATGTVTPVKIEYSTGGSYNLVTNNYTGVSGINIYNWTPIPPSVNSENCRVRVSDNRSAFAEVNSTSNNTFSIRPQIFILQPLSNDNVTAAANGTQAIRWNYTGSTIGDVKVQYTPNGTTWYDVDPDNANLKAENGSTYFWPNVPTLKTSQAKIRVYDVNNTNVVANSSTFNIRGYLNLTSPIGNENWLVGSSQFIQWQSAAITLVNVSYSLNGINWTPLGSSATSPYTWNISNSSQVSNSVKVMVADQYDFNTTSTSPTTFALLPVLGIQHPQSGDNVTAEEYYNITWTSKGLGADNVYLQYTPTGLTGGNWTNVTDAAVPNGASGGYYIWNPVPAGPLSNYCKLKVTYVNNANATVTGDDYFNLRGNLTVTRPVGGETWNISTTENITWTKKGNIPTVDIAYSLNNGNAGTWVPIATVNASDLVYPWNITNVTTTLGKIKIADSANPDIVYNVSTGLFSIKGRIAITYPTDPGIVMFYGNTSNITWQKFGDIPYINISYSADGGGTYPNQIANNLSGSSYSWEVPDAISNTLRIKVWDSADPAVSSTSANNFSIFGKIKVDKPDSPTEPPWIYGTTQTIQWTRNGTFYYFNIDGSSNGFADENQTWPIATNVYSVTNTSFFNYTLTGVVGEHISNNVKIRVSDAAAGRSSLVHDESDNPFIIKGKLTIIQPNGNESWSAGTNQTLRWDTGGNISNVKLEYLDGINSIPQTIIGSTASGSGIHDYIWNVSDNAVNNTTQAYIKVTDVNDESVNDTSDNPFLIKGSVTLLTPNGGERLLVNDNYNVTWTKTGNYKPAVLDTVKIEYSTNGTGGPFKSMHNVSSYSADQVPADAGYFSWQVDDDLSNNVRVRITRNADNVSVPASYSNSSLSIIGKLTVQEPGPGVAWNANDTYTIKWQRQGSIGLVDIGYFVNGTNYQPIVSSWPGSSSGNTTGNYSWNINNTTGIVSPNVTINVSDHNDSSVYNLSQQFRIIPKFLVTAPAGGDKLVANRQMYITWASWGGDFGPVNITYTDIDNGNQSYIINASAPNLGSYQWMVNDTLSDNVRVRISYPDYSAAYNDSGPFYIWPNYTVKAPTSSADHKWPVDTVQQIKWNCTSAKADYVNILYSIDGGLNYRRRSRQ